MRKGVIWILVILMLFSTACGESLQKAPDYIMEGYDGDVSYRVWDTNLFFERMQEKTGITFQYVQFTDYGKWTERKKELMTGENLPDVLFKAELNASEVRDLYQGGQIIDLTPYLHRYRAEAKRAGVSPARFLAMRMIRTVLAKTGITATAGIGTNLYLAKVGMDIVAKKTRPDADGVRIAELDEEEYKLQLWEHRPLTDFWQVGPGTARRLITHGMHTMGDVAAMSAANEEGLYRMFGVDAELLIDHAWGVEPVRMCDIKAYCPAGHSFSTGQVLPRPYRFEESLLVFREMAEQAVAELVGKKMRIPAAVWWISFDPASLEENPGYSGPVTLDFYGRLHPVHTGGTIRFRPETNSRGIILAALDKSFREKVNPGLLVRRIGLSLNDPKAETGAVQTDMFTDPEEQDRERRIQEAMIGVRGRFGRNALVRGMSLLEGATAMERNEQIGGHRA